MRFSIMVCSIKDYHFLQSRLLEEVLLERYAKFSTKLRLIMPSRQTEGTNNYLVSARLWEGESAMTKSGPFGKNDSDQATELDHSLLLAMVDGDNDLLRGVSGLFLDIYPRLMSAIHDAIARNDGNALGRAAHTLQGSGGYFLTDSSRKTLVELG